MAYYEGAAVIPYCVPPPLFNHYNHNCDSYSLASETSDRYHRVLPMKRRIDESLDHTSLYCCEGEEDDFRSSRSKRFLSEEMMSEHMQNLHLATPPHCTLFPDHHNGVNEFDWLKGSYDSSCIPQEYLDDSIPKATPTDHKDLAPPINNSRNCENTVTMEENSEDSSDDDNDTSIHMWIAPEMKSLLDSNKKTLKQSSSLIPNKILEDMNKPCQALVPVMESNISLLHSVWNNKNTSSENKASHNSQSVSPSLPLSVSESVPSDHTTDYDKLSFWRHSNVSDHHDNDNLGDHVINGNHGDHSNHSNIDDDDVMEL